MKLSRVFSIVCLIVGGWIVQAQQPLDMAAPAATQPAATQPAASQPATTRRSASVAVQIAPNQRWPSWLRVAVLCDAPPATEAGSKPKFVRILSIPEPRLTDARRPLANAQQKTHERRTEGLSTPDGPEDLLDPDGVVWLVVKQLTSVEPSKRIHFHILDLGETGHIVDGRRNKLEGRIRPDQYRPGTIEVYALWTEQGEVVAASPPVQVEVKDGTTTTRPTAAPRATWERIK